MNKKKIEKIEQKLAILALKLNKIIEDKNLNANKIYDKSIKDENKIHQSQIYQILRKGKNYRPNFGIYTLIKFLDLIDYELDIKPIENNR